MKAVREYLVYLPEIAIGSQIIEAGTHERVMYTGVMSTGRHTRQVLIGSTETRILLGKRRPVSGECESGLTIFDCTHAVLILVV